MVSDPIQLPAPRLKGEMSVEAALQRRRSVRRYRPGPIDVTDVSQLLWAAQGITDPRGYRTAPSAGAVFPLVVYVLVGIVNGLEAGVYRYLPDRHGLAQLVDGDMREEVFAAALRQSAVRKAPVALVLTAAFEAMTSRYGRRGYQYIFMEAGHAAQSVELQAVAMGLATVVIGAFEDDRLAERLGIPRGERPLYLIPVGRA